MSTVLSKGTLGTGPGRRGRSPSAAKHAAVIAAAAELFLSGGYARTSMDAITALAGVSKQTIYAHFGDKESLFLAVIADRRARAGDERRLEENPLLEGEDLHAGLVAFGEWHLITVLDPQLAALRRMLIGELTHQPRLRELWNIGGPTQLRAQLAAELHERTEALDIPSLDLAVSQLLALLSHEANMLTMYGLTPLEPPTRRRIATQAADLFLRAYSRSSP